MPYLDVVKDRLLLTQLGVFESDEYLLSYFTPELITLFSTYASDLYPEHVFFNIGRPLECHTNSLELATADQRGSAWFGFRFNAQGLGWWLHSWVVLGEVVIDSGDPTRFPLYVGIPWGWELYGALRKRPGAIDLKAYELPSVLGRSVLTRS